MAGTLLLRAQEFHFQAISTKSTKNLIQNLQKPQKNDESD